MLLSPMQLATTTALVSPCERYAADEVDMSSKEIKRESGANPEQARCCKSHYPVLA